MNYYSICREPLALLRCMGYAQDDGEVRMRTERVFGESLKSWIRLTDDWRATTYTWQESRGRIQQYIAAEMELLERGVMYRDLNLDHVIFGKIGAHVIDLEASLVANDDREWRLDDGQSRRGTWETMALEEFRRPSTLTTRTATYRVAVVVHLVLSGELPFVRKPLKRDTHAWRASHAALVAQDFPRPVRKVFAAALARESSRRYKSPEKFFTVLSEAYDAQSGIIE